jgi:nitroreductase
MVRSFTDRRLPPEELDHMLDLARRAPSAGNTSAIEFIVLDTPASVDRYWRTTLTDEKRARFRWVGLLKAPALVIVSTRPTAYLERYSENDKARPGLGQRTEAWAQPFWWIDAGMVAQNLLLIAGDRGWGASLFGLFDHESAVREVFDVPNDRRLVCTIALGEPAEGDEAGRSAGRGRPPVDQIIHRHQ